MFNDPIFFESTRVWRCYLGGQLLDEFTGSKAGADGYFPEDWLASVTRADNGEQQQSLDEGLSKVRGEDVFFADLLKKYPEEMLGAGSDGELGVLCKFLDSAMRLPIQCHPDREFARKYYNSEYGKTESWLILSTREINGEKPYILFGFKSGKTEEQFRAAVESQDIPAVCDCLNKVDVNPGEVYFIPGRLPHAIGPGLMLLEVQEPTDLVIQPERQIGDVTLSEAQMWGGLDHDTAFACFDYNATTQAKLLAKLRVEPDTVRKWDNARLERIIGPERTDCFRVDKLTIDQGTSVEFSHDASWYLGIVCAGKGEVNSMKGQPLCKGDRFFVSHQIKQVRYSALPSEKLEIYLVSR